ncbi:putative ATP dependent RNA helicase [Gamsiella multidivaricata]|uniref:putative ATP dependent RNA helicase n=1 Tax=Gamsiella multidivaricata TaxID=101098 RepID=UPI002220D007|nr:putative ATP dependent RNA helicase [Gamsiella multidivaricata]KAI7820234.1 putative ATP dependent RNA helicase [Gamsiella multidivaricata]
MHVKLGMEVGYTIRFEDCTDPGGKTRIKYMTDGMLFREALMDPLLSKYSVIMLDEAHERSLYTDILMGVLKKILKKRPELRVIISSATLDAEAFAAFFSSSNSGQSDRLQENAAILSVQGRMYPVDIHYLAEPTSDYIEGAIQTVFDIHTKEPAGDILVFMTGREEIEQVVSEIRERATTLPPNKYNEIVALPIYAGLSAEEQMLVFEPTEKSIRKVVVATNVAEASITIPGVGFVIDSGFVKIRAYNPRTGMEALTTTTISQASAEQRSGRAGRIRNGKAYRLYTEASFLNDMSPASVPEIQRSNLAGMVLQLKALGIENVLRFDFMTSPPAEMMSKALELIYSLKALDDYGRLTIPLGMRLAEFPLDPLLGKILLDSGNFNCSQEILTIAAMVSVQNVFVNPTSPGAEEQHRKFGALEGDHVTLLNVYNAFVSRGRKSAKWCANHLINFKAMSRALSIRSHLERYLVRVLNLSGSDQLSTSASLRAGERPDLKAVTVMIRKCLVSGYFAQAAKIAPDGTHWISVREDRAAGSSGMYMPTKLWMHPTSILFKQAPKWVIFHEVVETSQGKAYMREVTAIEPEWLEELAPHFYIIKRKS